MVHRGAPRRRKLWALGIVFCAAALMSASRPATADDVFSVTGVPVDVTADSATAAREQALLEGQRKAVRILLRRLTLKQDADALPAVSDAQLLEVVQGIEVESEKISTVRYLGKLTVRFKPDAVRALLRDANIPYAETVSKPLLVLPVYRTGESVMLWDESNPWLAAWANHVAKGGLVPLIVPLGDLTDMATITAEEAVEGVGLKLEALAHRYGTTDTLVVVATSAADQAGVDIAATRYAAAQQDRTDVMRVVSQPGETNEALLADAVAKVQAQVEEAWKQENILRFDQEQTLSVNVPLTGLPEWIAIRNALGGIAYIRSTEIVSLSKTGAVVNLHYIGDPGQLKLALAQKDLTLSQEGALWTLGPAANSEPATPAEAAPSEAAPAETAPEATTPSEAAPAESAPTESPAHESEPGESAPTAAAPAETAPAAAAPAQTAPQGAGAAPNDAAPPDAGGAPASAMPQGAEAPRN